MAGKHDTAPLLNPVFLGLTLAVCGPALALSPVQTSLYALPKLFLLSLGTLIAWVGLARFPVARERRWPLALPILAFAAVHLLTSAFSLDRVLSLLGNYTLYTYGLLPLGVCASLAWATACARERLDVDSLLRACLLAGAAAAVYGIAQKFGLDPRAAIPWMPTQLPHGRVGSTLGNPVYLGSVLLALSPLAARFVLRPARPSDRALGAAAGVLIAICLFLTGSRGAWLGAAAACGAYLAAASAGGRRVWVVAGLAALLAVAGVAALQAGRESRGADSGRVQLWISALRVVRRYPWLGTGPEAFQLALGRDKTEGLVKAYGSLGTQVHAHNDLLHVLATMGIVGLAAYVWLLWRLGLLLLRALADENARPTTAALGGALLGLFIQAKFNPVPLASLALASLFVGLIPVQAPSLHRRIALPFLACAGLACALSGLLLWADHEYFRAALARSQGLPEDALSFSRRSSRLNPAELKVSLYRAGLLFELARRPENAGARQVLLAEAAEVGRRALVWHPNDPDACHLSGSSLMAIGRLDEAARLLDRAIALDWSNPGPRENRDKLEDWRKSAGQ